MKVKVTKRFVDRDNKELKEVGKTYDYSKERADELKRNKYVVDVKVEEEAKEKK